MKNMLGHSNYNNNSNDKLLSYLVCLPSPMSVIDSFAHWNSSSSATTIVQSKPRQPKWDHSLLQFQQSSPNMC